MNITEAIAWQTVASFLRGELDHADETTRADIASACAVLDSRARRTLNTGDGMSSDFWDLALCRVATEEP